MNNKIDLLVHGIVLLHLHGLHLLLDGVHVVAVVVVVFRGEVLVTSSTNESLKNILR